MKIIFSKVNEYIVKNDEDGTTSNFKKTPLILNDIFCEKNQLRRHINNLPINKSRRWVNINGAVNLESMKLEMRYDDSINGESTIKLFGQLENSYPNAPKITVICDNARYYRSVLVKEYLTESRIELMFLPPYAPNLNLIERYWKYFKKTILYNEYYETFKEFKQACKVFFENPEDHIDPLRSLLAENFQIIDGKKGYSLA